MKAYFKGSIKESAEIFTYLFELQKPLTYKAGMYIYLTLPLLHYPDTRGNIRQFTISSSPTEGPLIRITAKDSQSGFKKTLKALTVGSAVEIDGPHGEFYFPNEVSGKHVFIAGGMGITPFRSILKYLSDIKQDTSQIKLIYSSSKEFLFENELTKISTFFARNRIDKEILDNYLGGGTTYWVCGPPDMVTSVENILLKLKAPYDGIISEKFTGY